MSATSAAEQVRTLYHAYGARRWEGAAAVLHPQAVVVMPATAERLEGRPAVLEFQRAYPEPWGTLTVRRVLGDAQGAAAELEVLDPRGGRFACAAFWRTEGGLLRHGVEYWVTVGGEAPPARRARAGPTRAARDAWDAGGGADHA